MTETRRKHERIYAMRPMPPDFPELARKLTGGKLSEHYHCGRRAVKRWYSECGVEPIQQQSQAVPPPEDFHKVAPLHTLKALRRMYKCGGGTIRRWAKETGVRYQNMRAYYVKHDEAAEIAFCLNCPLPVEQTKCSNCKLLRRLNRDVAYT